MTGAVSPRYTAIIIDDEPLAREGLLAALLRLSVEIPAHAIDVVATCANAFEGLTALRELRPDIAFVDVIMPELDGFAMVEQLEPEDAPAAIIFVTALENRAVRAFEIDALDYVVKPVSDSRLLQSVLRAIRKIENDRRVAGLLDISVENSSVSNSFLQQLVIPERNGKRVVPVSEIDWIEGDTYYVRVHTRGRERLLRARMQELERALNPAKFVRTHRSALVRLDLIREIRQESPFSLSIRLATGARVPLSRSRRETVESVLAQRR